MGEGKIPHGGLEYLRQIPGKFDYLLLKTGHDTSYQEE